MEEVKGEGRGLDEGKGDVGGEGWGGFSSE